MERRGPSHACHVDGVGIIAEEERAAVIWRPPQALLAECKVPAADTGGGVRVQQAELVLTRNRRAWLQWISVS